MSCHTRQRRVFCAMPTSLHMRSSLSALACTRSSIKSRGLLSSVQGRIISRPVGGHLSTIDRPIGAANRLDRIPQSRGRYGLRWSGRCRAGRFLAGPALPELWGLQEAADPREPDGKQTRPASTRLPRRPRQARQGRAAQRAQPAGMESAPRSAERNHPAGARARDECEYISTKNERYCSWTSRQREHGSSVGYSTALHATPFPSMPPHATLCAHSCHAATRLMRDPAIRHRDPSVPVHRARRAVARRVHSGAERRLVRLDRFARRGAPGQPQTHNGPPQLPPGLPQSPLRRPPL